MSHELFKKHSLIIVSLLLSGCMGTAALRDVDESKDYPNLHEVPDRPEKPDTAALKKELDQTLESNAKMLNQNQEVRSQTK